MVLWIVESRVGLVAFSQLVFHIERNLNNAFVTVCKSAAILKFLRELKTPSAWTSSPPPPPPQQQPNVFETSNALRLQLLTVSNFDEFLVLYCALKSRTECLPLYEWVGNYRFIIEADRAQLVTELSYMTGIPVPATLQRTDTADDDPAGARQN